MSNVFGTVVGMGFHGTLGAAATTDFGKKGMALGAGVGAGGFLLGETLQDDENPTLAGAVMSGMVSGSIQSAFSSAQEIYAFHNPGHISNVSSINTTTSATTIANAMYTPFTKEGKEQWKTLRDSDSDIKPGKKRGIFESAFKMFETNTMTPENILSDVTRMNMIYNDNEAGSSKLLRMMGLDKDSGGFNPIGAMKGQYEDMWEAARVADEGGVWFGQGKKSFDMESKTFFGQKLDKDGNLLTADYFNKAGEKVDMPDRAEKEGWGMGRDKWFKDNDIDHDRTMYYKQNPLYGTKSMERFQFGPDNKPIQSKPHVSRVELNGNETIDERMAKYMDANKIAYERVIGTMAERDKASGKTPVFNKYDDFRNYLTGMDGGALGTYRELKKAGFYDSDTPTMKKAVAYGTETMYGSPAWGRIVDKQLENGTAQLENYTDDKGHKKVRFTGGGKTARIGGLIADIATGGAINAALNVGIYAAAAPFRGGEGAHAINANNAINPL